MNGENDKLKEFIRKHIKYGDNKETLYILEEGGIKPSKQLQDNILNMLMVKKNFLWLIYKRMYLKKQKD